MITDPEIRTETDRGVSKAFLEETGQRAEVDGETLQEELLRIIGMIEESSTDASSTPRELTAEEERDVDRGWTTPAAIRARDKK